jgi:hypothetical protein
VAALRKDSLGKVLHWLNLIDAKDRFMYVGSGSGKNPSPRITARLCLTAGRAVRYAQPQDKAAFLRQRATVLASGLLGTADELFKVKETVPRIGPCPPRNVKTLHAWAMSPSLSVPFDKEKREEFGKNLLEKLGHLDDEAKFDAVFVHEAQDFDPIWLECVRSALKDPEDGDLIVVADANQGIYKPKSYKWKDVRIKAVGRMIPLRVNYRNTKEILALAGRFTEAGEQDTGEEIVPLTPEAALRNGPPPLVIPARDRVSEAKRAVELVCGLLKGQWDSDLGVTPLAPD